MARHGPPQAERGAALLAVLAMVVLLAGFASVGLAHLQAATRQVADASARQQAMLLADSGVAAARFMVTAVQANADPAERQKPVTATLPQGRIVWRFASGANCFNLNSLSPPPAEPGAPRKAAQSRPEQLAALLTAAGIDPLTAGSLATATADYLANRGVLWADGSEWTTIPGVTAAHWQAAGRWLCALPGREATALDINGLTADDAPLLAAVGVPVDEARRLLASRPAAGWASANDFWGGTTGGRAPDSAGAQVLGTKNRWVKVEIEALTADARVTRTVLLDTVPQPAHVAAVVWGATEIPPRQLQRDQPQGGPAG